MSDTCGQAISHGSHCHSHLSGTGKGAETTKVVLLDAGGNFGIDSPNPFEKRCGDFGPEDQIIASNNDQPFGQNTRLPGSFR
jgi:hypothetical protein